MAELVDALASGGSACESESFEITGVKKEPSGSFFVFDTQSDSM